MIRLLISGASGRTGSRIHALAMQDSRFNVHGVLRHAAPDDNFPTQPGEADALIDFSTDAGARRAIAMARTLQTSLIIGTTGLSESTKGLIDAAAREIAVLAASNTSLGIAVMRRLVRDAGRRLPGADIHLVEQHRAGKRDAPSGTAKALVEDIENSVGAAVRADRVHSVRAGDIVGQHEVQFTMAGERLVLTHVATDRDVFARGALDAAAWLTIQPPGNYEMDDVVRGVSIVTGQA